MSAFQQMHVTSQAELTWRFERDHVEQRFCVPDSDLWSEDRVSVAKGRVCVSFEDCKENLHMRERRCDPAVLGAARHEEVTWCAHCKIIFREPRSRQSLH
eukprot:1135208-Rhodomonas_salina.1